MSDLIKITEDDNENYRSSKSVSRAPEIITVNQSN